MLSHTRDIYLFASF